MDEDEDNELIDPPEKAEGGGRKAEGDEGADFAAMTLENLKAAGVQQARKEGKLGFTSLTPWPGRFVRAEGRYTEGQSSPTGDEADGAEKRSGVCVGPEFDRPGRVPAPKARTNADPHTGADLKTTDKANLFVIFGEPEIGVLPGEPDAPDDGTVRVKPHGADVFEPQTGRVQSSDAAETARRFPDTDYGGESFFVRRADFPGADARTSRPRRPSRAGSTGTPGRR